MGTGLSRQGVGISCLQLQANRKVEVKQGIGLLILPILLVVVREGIQVCAVAGL